MNSPVRIPPTESSDQIVINDPASPLIDHGPGHISSERMEEDLKEENVNGVAYTWEYVLDWLCVTLSIMVVIISEAIPPRQVYVMEKSLYLVSYPHGPNTVPSWSVGVISIIFPITCFVVYKYMRQRPALELHHLILGLMTAVTVTAAITNCIKVPVGRLRPDFAARCWGPSGLVQWKHKDDQGGYPLCTGAAAEVKEGRKSFPSGHSSWSAAGLGYLSLWCWSILKAFDGSGHAWRLVAGGLPALGAVAVGVSRVTDYWHHWTDVVAGLVLGFTLAYVAFKQQYNRICQVPSRIKSSRFSSPAGDQQV